LLYITHHESEESWSIKQGECQVDHTKCDLESGNDRHKQVTSRWNAIPKHNH